MARYMLIDVCDREIWTKIYDSFEEAHDVMMRSLREDFSDKCGRDDEAWEEANTEHWSKTDLPTRTNDFDYGETWAWSNLLEYCPRDWAIECVD